MKQFPHMQDTAFPGTPANAYQYRNEFDYSRWPENVKINVLNVKWNSDYKDVPAFDTKAERDEWLDAHASVADSFILQTMMRNVFDGAVKLPIPYGVMSRYNYLFVDIPMATSPENPIAYERESGVRRYCYFVEDMEQAAPSTTKCRLTLDAWTTYINDVQIPYMQLERGHAPMAAAATVDEFLADPAAHTENLLAADVNFGEADRVTTSKLYDVGAGEKWVLFATTVAPELIGTLADAGASAYVPPSYRNDANNRAGYQDIIDGYDWSFGRDYTSQNAPTLPWETQGETVPNGYTVYALPAQDARAWFDAVATRCPALMRTIGGVFVLARDLFELATEHIIFGHHVWEVRESAYTKQISLTPNDFAYPDAYKGLTKLYTFPYATLTVSDDMGREFEMRVENTSPLTLRCPVTLAFPYLVMQAFVVGANGAGEHSFVWTNLDGSATDSKVPEGDLSKFMLEWAIPTYTLKLSAATEYALDSARDNATAKRAAENAYHGAVRGANTAYENACDSADTAKANADASADTGKANADRSADTGKTNADASANTGKANADRSAATTRANANVANTAANTTNAANDTLIDDTNGANRAMAAQAVAGAQHVMAAGLLADATAATQSLVTAAGITAVGAVVGGDGLSAAPGLASTTASYGVALGKEAAMVNAQSEADMTIWSTNNAQTINIASYQKTFNAASKNAGNTQRTDTANNNAGTTEANASATQATTKANAGRTQGTAKTNAGATQGTAKANAGRTQGTAKANAGYSRVVAVDSAKWALELAQSKALNDYQRGRASAPVEYGTRSGDAMPDAMRRRVVHVRVKTQLPDAIAQAGDYFLRYGYASNRNWGLEHLCPMPHFCYWRATDATVVDGLGVANSPCLEIQRILESGVTTWKDPDEIGQVSIYDN